MTMADIVRAPGIERRIRRAYEYICRKYSDANTEIILIGFSRGTLVVHGIASLISDVGIVKDYPNELFEMWSNVEENEVKSRTLHEAGISAIQTKFMRKYPHVTFHTDVRIKACALFDSVWKSWEVGGWDPQQFLTQIPFLQAKCVKLPSLDVFPAPKVDYAFHAMALNETRFSFPLERWRSNRPGLKECWFIGHHSDVGGSCDESGPENLSFIWMIDQLRDLVPLNIKLVQKMLKKGVLREGRLHVNVPWKDVYLIPAFRRLQERFFQCAGRQQMEGDLVHWTVRQLAGAVETDFPKKTRLPIQLRAGLAEEDATDFELEMLAKHETMNGRCFTSLRKWN